MSKHLIIHCHYRHLLFIYSNYSKTIKIWIIIHNIQDQGFIKGFQPGREFVGKAMWPIPQSGLKMEDIPHLNKVHKF